MSPILFIQTNARALVLTVLAVLAVLGLVWLIFGPMIALAGVIVLVLLVRGVLALLTPKR